MHPALHLSAALPVVCDMTGAPDTLSERMDEYRRLFALALIGRERTADGFVFRFRDDPGVGAWVRDLAVREHDCCGFFRFEVEDQADEVQWRVAAVDEQVARRIVDEFFSLPDALSKGDESVSRDVRTAGLTFVTDEGDAAVTSS